LVSIVKTAMSQKKKALKPAFKSSPSNGVSENETMASAMLAKAQIVTFQTLAIS